MEQFIELEARLISKCEKELSEEEIPWDYEIVIKELISKESLIRIEKSAEWIKEIVKNESTIHKMNASEANQLLNQTLNPPLYISNDHREHISRISKKLNDRLSDLSIEWLIEKFNELSDKNKKEFLNIISDLLKANSQKS